MVLLLNESQVSELYTMKDALVGVEMALRELGEGTAVNQPRNRVMTGNGVAPGDVRICSGRAGRGTQVLLSFSSRGKVCGAAVR